MKTTTFFFTVFISLVSLSARAGKIHCESADSQITLDFVSTLRGVAHFKIATPDEAHSGEVQVQEFEKESDFEGDDFLFVISNEDQPSSLPFKWAQSAGKVDFKNILRGVALYCKTSGPASAAGTMSAM